jgi:hypothetical protein
MRSSLFSLHSWLQRSLWPRRLSRSTFREAHVFLGLLACCLGSYVGASLPELGQNQGLGGIAVAQPAASPSDQSSPTPNLSLSSPTPVSPTPNSTERPGDNSGSSFNPDSISNLQVTNYAKAVLEIEQVRVKFHHQATKALGGALPQNTCLGNANIPPRLEAICKNYLQASRTIVDKYRLSPTEFNSITQRSRTDVALMNRIRQELVRWQRVRSAGTRANGTPVER